VHHLVLLPFLELHAWAVSVLDQRPTRCRVPHNSGYLPDGPFLNGPMPQRLPQDLRRDLLFCHIIFAITGTSGRFVRWNHQLPSVALIESSFSECSRVGILTVEAITRHCPNLLSLDLSHTSVTPVSLVGVLQSCGRLETLKVAGIKNWVRAL